MGAGHRPVESPSEKMTFPGRFNVSLPKGEDKIVKSILGTVFVEDF